MNNVLVSTDYESIINLSNALAVAFNVKLNHVQSNQYVNYEKILKVKES